MAATLIWTKDGRVDARDATVAAWALAAGHEFVIARVALRNSSIYGTLPADVIDRLAAGVAESTIARLVQLSDAASLARGP